MKYEDFPSAWLPIDLEKIGRWGSGGTPSRKNPEYFNGDIPWIKTGELGNRVVNDTEEKISKEAIANSSAKIFPAGSIAIAMYGATIGKTSILGIDAATNQACGVVTPDGKIVDRIFLYYLLRNEKGSFIAKGKGGAQPNISQEIIKTHKVQLPPFAEQKQIATTLDELLAQVDTIKARLDAIPAILKRFRQSVLAAAVSGRLTEGWRQEVNVSSWSQVKLVDICDSERALTYGVIKLGEEVPDGVPCLRTSNVRWLRIDAVGIKKIDPVISREYSRTVLHGNEVLVNVRGTLGGVVVVPAEMKGWNVSREVAVVPVSKNLAISMFIALLIASNEKQKWLTGVQKGVAYTGINIEDLRALPVSLPSIEEQTEIVRRADQLFAFADQIEARVRDATARVNHLEQSILAKAFRGELTADWRAQNPDLISGENSAEALLALIRADRQKATPAKREKRKKL